MIAVEASAGEMLET
jgi:hypothetical protein